MDRATMGVEPHLHRVLVTMTFLIHYLFDLLNASAKHASAPPCRQSFRAAVSCHR
jgi:hypothetical protein